MEPGELLPRLVAILAADAVDYSRLMAHDDQATIRQPALGLQDGLTRPVNHRLVAPAPVGAPALGRGKDR